MQFCLLVLIINGISSLFAAEWSEWMDITPCSSTPCECPPYDTKCSEGKKAQIRSCIRKEREIDSCKGGGPFQVVSGCNNRNICPGWSEWTEWSECDCNANQTIKERRCNNPPPIHPDVLCVKYNSDKDTEETSSEQCQCSADRLAETTPLPATIKTDPPGTTERPWCCEMYLVKNDTDAANESAYDDYPADREARSADYYHYYDNICRECSEKEGYNGTHGKPEDDNKPEPNKLDF